MSRLASDSGDRSAARAPRHSRSWELAVWTLALGVFALAYLSPVEHADSDPAMALLVSQALLDHHTPRLDAYRDDPAMAYSFEANYRVYRFGGSSYYYSPSVGVLSLPIVWLANRLGVHMLDQTAELALQNLISALCCALIAVVLFRLCRVYLEPWASLAVASVSLLGSPLVSTLATGLWNSVYEILFLALALLGLVRYRAGEPTRLSPAGLAGLAVLAFLCRPTAAFAILGALLALVPPAALRRKSALALAAAGALLVLILAHPALAGKFPPYFSPWKLLPRGSLPEGLWGVLFSPSRGLFVFCPFLVPVVAGALWSLPRLTRDPLFRLAAAWSALHVLAVAGKAVWWGGHSYGPRLLAELVLPAVLVTCLVWRQLERRAGRWRFVAAGAYLALGLGAVFIHGYQGLFNPATSRWNWTPDVDDHPQRIFDWRQPQFLASDRSIEARLFELRRRELGVYALGEEVPHDGGGALFRGWYEPEGGWRWSRGASSEVLLRLGDLPPNELYLLRLRAGTLGRREVALEINGAAAGSVEIEGHAGRERAFALRRDLLRPGAENVLRIEVPDAVSPPGDPRLLGLALYAFALHPLPDDFAVDFGDEPFFVEGFSGAEGGWRWTDGRRAVVDYPIGPGAGVSTLTLEARTLDRQTAGVRINGVDVGELDYPGGFGAAVTRRIDFDPAVVRPFRMNRIELTLPRARRTPEDPRLLGLALVRLELHRGEPR